MYHLPHKASSEAAPSYPEEVALGLQAIEAAERRKRKVLLRIPLFDGRHNALSLS